MKSKMKIKIKLLRDLWCLPMVLLVVSCAKGFDNNEVFSGGVKNAQLESPTLDETCFSTMTSGDLELIKVTWPVIFGAGGYEFDLSVVGKGDPTDPTGYEDYSDNPIVVVADSILDGCSVAFIKEEDTFYKVSIRTLGNEQMNNKEAGTATVYDYNTLVPAVTIPAGSDIAEFVNQHLEDVKEQCFALEAGRNYTLNSIVDFGIAKTTFRGDVNDRPTIVIGPEGGIVTEGGLKTRYINFDCSAMTSQVGVLTLGTPTSKSPRSEVSGSVYVIDNPISFQGCNFTGINKSFIDAGDKGPWAVKEISIKDCIVQLKNSTSSPIINFEKSGGRAIKTLTLQNSTFYNLKTNSSGRFIRMNNASNAQPKKSWNDSKGAVNITYCTFYQTMSNKEFANNTASTSDVTITMKWNIFYNTWRLQKMMGSCTKDIENNFLWSSGGDNVGTLDSTDKTYGTEEDPQFEGLPIVDQTPDVPKLFTPASGTQAYGKAGDPRWYK